MLEKSCFTASFTYSPCTPTSVREQEPGNGKRGKGSDQKRRRGQSLAPFLLLFNLGLMVVPLISVGANEDVFQQTRSVNNKGFCSKQYIHHQKSIACNGHCRSFGNSLSSISLAYYVFFVARGKDTTQRTRDMSKISFLCL